MIDSYWLFSASKEFNKNRDHRHKKTHDEISELLWISIDVLTSYLESRNGENKLSVSNGIVICPPKNNLRQPMSLDPIRFWSRLEAFLKRHIKSRLLKMLHMIHSSARL